MKNGKIIVAVAKNMVIGNKGKMPWNFKEDLEYFKEKTMGHIVVMGRKTFESIGKPLMGRTNIILSKKVREQPGIIIFRDVDSLIRYLDNKLFFVIGGETIFNIFLPYIKEIYLTQINLFFEGDTFFPKLDNNWKMISQKKGKNPALVFKKFHRVS